jgi:hypothetical protein
MLISLALENNIIGRYTNVNDFLIVQKHIFAPSHFRCGVASAILHHPVYATDVYHKVDILDQIDHIIDIFANFKNW